METESGILSSTPARGQSATRVTSLLVFLLLLVLQVPFLPEFNGANSMTRLMLVSAIVDEGTTRIDSHQDLTIDKSFFQGHYYSDKAPGMAFLGLPAYVAAQASAGLFRETIELFPKGEETRAAEISRLAVYRLIVLSSGGLLAALAGLFFFRMATAVTGNAWVGFLATVMTFVATPMFGWSTQFFGHAAAGATLFIAFALAFSLTSRGERPSGLRALLAGVCLALSVSIEYTAAPAAALVGGYALWRLREFPARDAVRLVAIAFIGGCATILPVLVYHSVSFGGPFSVGYAEVVGFEGMEQGFMGLTYPSLKVVVHIAALPLRGILWIAPVLVLGPVAVFLAIRNRFLIPEIVLSVLVISYYFLLNASYYYWEGGASIGPRHVTPAIPFMGIPFIWLWWKARGVLRASLWALSAVSLFISFAAANVYMIAHGGHAVPLWDPVITGLVSGESSFSGPTSFARLGTLGASPGIVLALWAAIASALIWSVRGRTVGQAP